MRMEKRGKVRVKEINQTTIENATTMEHSTNPVNAWSVAKSLAM